MKYVECPQIYEGKEKSLFIAGGITGCSDWQNEFVNSLKDENIILFNPRREIFIESHLNDLTMTNEQISWEHNYLEKASATSFWFTSETLCPITLFELGKQLMLNKPVFIGLHPNYARKLDVEIQVKLMRPEIEIVYDLNSLSAQVKNWINSSR